MPIYTVLGPIPPSALGPTSMHEHCLVDARVWTSPAGEPMPASPLVTIENLGFLRWNFHSLSDNLLLDDPELAIRELSPLSQYGDSAIVDLTPSTLTTQEQVLAEVSRRAGVHIVRGCGFYVHPTHPDWVETATASALKDFFVSELTDGIGDTGIRPGIIGELGTLSPPTQRELRILAAAGEAAAETGAAVNVHLDPFGHHGLTAVQTLRDSGVAPDRIVLSHLDAYIALDHSYHRELASTGVILEFDNFGLEQYTTLRGELARNASDLERLQHLAGLIHDGFVGQLVLGLDVFTKAQLCRFGGTGYDHLLKRLVPVLQEQFDVTDAQVRTMLVDTPRRVLDRPAVADE